MGVRSGQNAPHPFHQFSVVLELIIWYGGINFILFIINFICFSATYFILMPHNYFYILLAIIVICFFIVNNIVFSELIISYS